MRSSRSVFPTPVGMVRPSWTIHSRSIGFPHARGDGPEEPGTTTRWVMVFPTPVGMVRADGRCGTHDERFPHARGDGPTQSDDEGRALAFSPRPWGWSISRGDVGVCASVFPHARGDGPQTGMTVANRIPFSPRPWGWSAGSRGRPPGTRVFPTPVGMVRIDIALPAFLPRFPHARGDGPNRRQVLACDRWFSPRPWGWSG